MNGKKMAKSILLRKHSIICFIFLFVAGSLFFLSHGVLKKSPQVSDLKDVSKDAQIELLLPVNVLKTNESNQSRANLLVSIPEDFRSVYPLSIVMQADMNEFIPKTDKDVNSWSEIITTNKYIGKSLNTSQVTDHLKRAIGQVDLSARVLESDNNECENYSESTFLMIYSHNGRREIVYGKYYSGPSDCSGFQYAIALNETMTEEKAKHKIKEFVKKNTDIIKF